MSTYRTIYSYNFVIKCVEWLNYKVSMTCRHIKYINDNKNIIHYTFIQMSEANFFKTPQHSLIKQISNSKHAFLYNRKYTYLEKKILFRKF